VLLYLAQIPVFAGEVKDLDWDHESKKIVAVGDGSGQVSLGSSLYDLDVYKFTRAARQGIRVGYREFCWRDGGP
jgi:hypothetical protein